MFSLRLRQFLLEHFLSLLEEADSLEAVEQLTSIPRAYGQYGPDGSFTPRQATLMPRPGQIHTTVNLGGRRVALGDTPRYTPPSLQPPRNSPVAVATMPFMPTAFFAPAELLVPFSLEGGEPFPLPAWLAFQQPPAVQPMTDEMWLLGLVPDYVSGGGPGGQG